MYENQFIGKTNTKKLTYNEKYGFDDSLASQIISILHKNG